jgi:hypothetical protein
LEFLPIAFFITRVIIRASIIKLKKYGGHS